MSKREIKLAKHYAHRGYHVKPQIPENSMAAFRRAVEYGLGSEFDVHLIADGSLVIFHDEKLERQTGVKGEIEDYDITNLRKLRLEGTDEMIPTFDEVLDLYEDTGLPLLIELKSAQLFFISIHAHNDQFAIAILGNKYRLFGAAAKLGDTVCVFQFSDWYDSRHILHLRG